MRATKRITDDDRKILSNVRLDHVRQQRPQQLAERAALVAALAPPDQDTLKREAALASELEAAERAADAARNALNVCLNRVSHLRINRHGRSHGETTRDMDARARLRALSHPAIPHIERALTAAAYTAMAVVPSIVGMEIGETPIGPDDEELRRGWFRPAMRRTSRPISTHPQQSGFIEAISAARGRVEDITYQALDDDAVVATLRAELDALVALNLPLSLAHVQMGLSELRRKLDRSALELWHIDEEEVA